MLAVLDVLTILFFVGMTLYVLYLALPTILHLSARVQLAFVADPAAGVGEPSPQKTGQVPSDTRDLANVLEPIRRRFKVPSLAAALLQDGQLRALGVVGVRRAFDLTPVEPFDKFHLGSCTKAMTATLCAVLVAQNKLGWDSTINEVFPDLDIHAAYRPVTLEQLLTHRAGISEGFSFSVGTWFEICKLSGPIKEQRRNLITLVLKNEPSAPPGSKHQYSNCGYTIAGAICEQVTGRGWEDLMREHIFEPLGMASAGFGPPGTIGRVDQPWGHNLSFFTRKWKPMPPDEKADNPAVIGPAGTVHCSMADWAKFVNVHLGESNALGLSADAIRLLHSPTLGGDYAFGWTVIQRDWAGGKALNHAGSNTMWFSVTWLAPYRKLTILTATNLGTQTAFRACDAAVGKLLDVAKS